MKPIITMLLLVVAAASLSHGKVYFAPKPEMIAKSDVIALVEITQVTSLEPQIMHGDQMAKATVTQVLKGAVQEKTEIEFRVPCKFPCAVAQVSTGRHLVFLAGKEKELKGNNWHLSYRPIKDGKLDWYKDNTSYALAPQSLDAVLEDVKMVLKPTPVAWGESANGLQAGLTLKSTSREPRVSAVLVFHLRNAGDKPVKILKLSAQAWFWGEYLPLEIRSSGTILKYQGQVLDPPAPPNESAYITLKPGDVDATEVTFVPEHWKLAIPFEAQAVFVFKQTLRENKTVGPYDHDKRQWRTVGGLWTGEARSQAVRVKMGVQTIGEEGSPISGLKITRDQAASIARKHLEAESFASTYDTARMTVKYIPRYGSRKAPFACWMVDFAKVGTGEIFAGSGQWEMGYMVLVDPDTGKVKEATGYKR